jgi:hypothetical protein
LEVQPEEVRMAICLQVILDAGWSLTEDNFEHFLEVSGVNHVKQLYWSHIGDKIQKHQEKEEDKLRLIFETNKAIFANGEGNVTNEQLAKI